MGQGAAHRRQDRLEPAGRPRQRHAERGLARVAGGGRRRAGPRGQAGDRRLVRRHRARPARAGPAAGRAAAGAVAGGGCRRPDLAGRRLPGRVQGAQADGGADPAHAGRYRGAPPLSQRAPDHRDAADAGRRPRRQRERYGGDQRDPLRRQRPPLGARRQHDERGLPRAALRHRRPLHGPARQRPGGAAARRGARRSRPRSRPWRAAPAPSCRAAAW